MLNADVGCARASAAKDVPFYKNYYVGGIGSVRGFDQARSAPSTGYRRRHRLDRRHPQAVANAEFFFPMPGAGRTVPSASRPSSMPATSGAGTRTARRRHSWIRTSVSAICATVPAWHSRGFRRSAAEVQLRPPAEEGRTTRSSGSSSSSAACSRAGRNSFIGGIIESQYPLLVALAVLGLSQTAFAETKIGFVNSDRVMRETASAVRAQRLEKEFEKRDQGLQRIARDLKSMQEDLERNGPTMGDSDRRNKGTCVQRAQPRLPAQTASSAKT